MAKKMRMGCANYRTFIDSAIYLICLSIFSFQFSVKESFGNNLPLPDVFQNPGNLLQISADRQPLNGKRITKIVYQIDAKPVTATAEELNILQNQTAVREGDGLSRYAIQQSLKALYATRRYSPNSGL